MLPSSPALRSALARLRLVAIGGVSVTLPVAACSPPTCDDPVHETRDFEVTQDPLARLTPAGGPAARSYASCRELCDDAPEVLDVESCTVGPRATAGDGGTRLGVKCVGLWAQCTNHYAFGSGRRPEGFVDQRLGSLLASMARLEGASAVAFERLAEELAFHGAPPELVASARAAIEDERLHERLVTDLARAHGESCVRYEGARAPVRSLFAMALENAREGVVFESFGALLNGLQAHDAPDASVRALFGCLAEDEVNHAALSLHVHRWAVSRLDATARAKLASEIRTAHDAIAATCGPDRRRGRLLGHPPRSVQLTVLAALDAEVLQQCA